MRREQRRSVFGPDKTEETKANALIISSDVVSLKNDHSGHVIESPIHETVAHEIFSKDSRPNMLFNVPCAGCAAFLAARRSRLET
jgi:hypothetical protein